MNGSARIILRVAATVVIAVAGLSSCSTKKNTAASRNYQAFITRYNVYFNGDEHFKETLKTMERDYEDDYTDFVVTHPAEARANPKAPQPSGNFDRSIEKAQKAIQLRSIKKRPARKPGKSSDPAYKAWMKREEYNPFLHNAWMMMGRSQYFNGDFGGAASTFYYITRHFSWLPETVAEATVWQARSYVAMGWLFEAENLLGRVKKEMLDSHRQLRDLYNLTEASLYVHQRDYARAIPPLEAAAKAAGGSQKTRLYFLLGQCLAAEKRNAEAYVAFKKAGGSANTSYRTKFNARIKQSEVYAGNDIESEVRALRRMTRSARNREFEDQIYYAIGNLYLSRRDTVKAIDNYIKAAERSTRNGIEKAISNVTLGGLYFAQGRYDLAQPRYSEAIPLLPETFSDYAALKRRSDVLDELAVYSQNVTLQDSLLRLAAMPEDERLAVIDKIIADLKKKEKEEAEAAAREEYLANAEAQGQANQNGNANAPTTFTMNTDNSWYFYNRSTLAAGRTDFQRRWGSRKLEDDWRRRNKASFSFDDFNSDETDSETEAGDSIAAAASDLTQEEKDSLDRISDPHFREYYLAQIPMTDLDKLNANDVIQEGLYSMGGILKDKLEDFGAARTQWDKLLERYPDNIYRLDVYYNLYLMYMRLGDTAEAEHWRHLILTDFAESKYGQALLDEHYIDRLREMPARQQAIYDRAYEAYLNNDNATVHGAYEEMMHTYPLSDIMPKFMFLHALAYVTERRPDDFNATLMELLQRYPETDLTPLASSYLRGMAQGRKLNAGSTNLRGMLWDIRLTNDTTLTATDQAAEFELDPDTPQLLVLVYPTDSISGNLLLYEVARHNFSSFVVKDFDLEPMNFGRLGMLVIKGFATQEELNHYRRVMDASTRFSLPEGVRPVMISEKNFQTLITQGRSLEEYFNFLESLGEEEPDGTEAPPPAIVEPPEPPDANE